MEKHIFLIHFVNLCQNSDFRTRNFSAFCAECLKTSFGYDRRYGLMLVNGEQNYYTLTMEKYYN